MRSAASTRYDPECHADDQYFAHDLLFPIKCGVSAGSIHLDEGMFALQVGESIMLAQSDLTQAALGMSLGYFAADIAVIVSHFPAMVGAPSGLFCT